MIYDLLIVGGGPAGIAAGVYAGRKKLKTALIADQLAGQSVVSGEINNWIGEKSISGFDLAKKMDEHVRSQDIEIIEGDLVEKIYPVRDRSPQGGRSHSPEARAVSNGIDDLATGFAVETKSGKKFETKTILIASGSRHRKLDVPGEKEFGGNGVFYCATCDAPLFKNKAVAVVGAGNAGLEAARDLASYASKIYLMVRSERIKGDTILFDEISKNPKVEVMYDSEVKKILGDKSVTGLEYLDKKAGSIKKLELNGIFVEIGSIPNTELVKDLVQLDKWGQIIVDHKTQMSSMKGIWAAGDVCDTLYKQNNIAAGDAIKAVLNINDFLSKK